MKTVCQLDENHADIPRHRNKDLPMVGGLIFRIILPLELQGTDLGNGFHKIGNFLIKQFGEFLAGDTGIFNRIVQ